MVKTFFQRMVARFPKTLPFNLERAKDPRLWRLQRGNISRGIFLGTVCAFMPVPMQMLMAASVAVLWRAHLPVSVIMVWISNPITILPMMYAATSLGAYLLEKPMMSYELFQLHGVMYPLANSIVSLLLGGLILGVVLGAVLSGLCYFLWGYSVSRRRRDKKRYRYR